MSSQSHTRAATATAGALEWPRLTVRAMLAAIFVTTPVLAFFFLKGQTAGLSGAAFGLAIFALSQLAALALLVWWVRSAIAASRRDQQALRESATRFHNAFDFAAIGMALVSPEGRWTQVNRALCEIVGYGEPELLGLTFQQITHPDDLSSDLNSVRRMLAGEIETFQMEKRYLHKQGHNVWVLLSVSLVRDQDGKPVHFISQIQDIAQRKQAELALAKSEALLRLITDNSPACIGYLDTDQRFRFCNRTYQEWYGEAAHAFIGRSIREVVGDDAYSEVEIHYRKALAGHPASYERSLRRDGKPREILVDLIPHLGGSGSVLGAYVCATDITARVNNERALRESEERFQLVARGSDDGIWDWNLETDHCYFSPRYMELLGCAEHEFAPEHASFVERLHPDDLELCAAWLRAHFAERIPYEVEYRLRTKSGSYRWFHARGQATWNADGKPVRFTGSLRDITPRHEAEERFQKTSDLLRQTERMARMGGWELDTVSMTPLWSEEVYRIFELESAGRPDFSDIIELYAPDERRLLEGAMRAAVEEGPPWDLELARLNGRGEQLWIRSQGRAETVDGRVTRLFGMFQDITERKMAEIAAERSRQFLDGVIESIPQPVFVKDAQHRWVLFNSRFCEMMERKREELQGKSDPDIYPLELVSRFWAEDDKAFSLDRPLFVEDRVVRSDGSVGWLLKSKRAVDLPDGAYVVGVATDITVQKETENALRESEEALRKSEESHRLLADNSSDMISRLTPQGALQYASPAAAVVLGFAPDQLVGHPVDEFIHPDDAEMAIRLFSEVVKYNKANVLTCRLRHREAGWVWVETSFRAVREKGSSWTSQVIGVSRNVDERVHVTEALNRFQYVLDRTLDMIFIADTQTLRFSYVNLGAAATLGYPREKLIGMTPWEVRADVTEAEYRKTIEPFLRGEMQSRQFETFHRRADGTEFPVDVSLQIVRRPGEEGLFVWIIRDATERKKIDRMKNEFVSTVSHELRTPLTSIRGSLGLIIGGAVGALTEPASNLVRIAYNNSERLVRLINDILDIEKIESGKMRFELQPQRIRPLLELALEANRHYGEQLGVRFEVLGEIPDGVIAADSDRFMQVMSNLLSNAAKFSPSPGTVEIRTTRREGALRIEVIDHGPGIPADFRDKIFGKFCQADSSDTRQKGGTGLGLSIAKAIVEKHGGQIGFDTQIGVGTTFHVTFPTTVAALPAVDELPVTAGTRRLDTVNPAARRPNRRATRH